MVYQINAIFNMKSRINLILFPSTYITRQRTERCLEVLLDNIKGRFYFQSFLPELCVLKVGVIHEMDLCLAEHLMNFCVSNVASELSLWKGNCSL